MKHALKAMLIAGALGAGAFFTGAAPASAQYYHQPSVSVYIGVDGRRHYRDRDYYRHRHYYRDDWRRRAYARCHRYWRHGYWHRDCGRHYGWRNDRRRHYRDW